MVNNKLNTTLVIDADHGQKKNAETAGLQNRPLVGRLFNFRSEARVWAQYTNRQGKVSPDAVVAQ